jgi:hypothetical protein
MTSQLYTYKQWLENLYTLTINLLEKTKIRVYKNMYVSK